ncbi:acetate--CoA ligase family protein [Sinorhizobium americanum]|uniref:Acyl-CoA synthetase (NDP forming) n=1 Tax=Sinorhizobium americanum TaxID=194963 RepID=A0A4R2B1R4_9HYPH|nr:acetate--CoA ligase family protein [Sinorhizobium americanum]TCN20371.1 acyl-CoA synthetase (NDP forming) [Sinorhizobium americanum]
MNMTSRKFSADLSGLFNPRSVAVIGASSTPGKWGFEYARQLLKGQSGRDIFLVNHNGGNILGNECYTSVQSLPVAPELAVICVPAAHVRTALQQVLENGTHYIVCVTAGFKEAGEEGVRLENEMQELVRASGARLVGPNCVGLYDATANLACTAFWDLPPGDIGIISQSGGVIIELGTRLQRLNRGISRAVSVGNQADLSVAEFIESFATDSNTKVITAYIEEFRDGRRLFEAIEYSRSLGKEVILLAPQAGEAVGRSVASHTGSMISNEDVLASACAELDVVRVRSIGDLLLALRAYEAPARARGRRVAVVADGGGAATLGTDAAVAEGLEVPAFSGELVRVLQEISPMSSGLGNPVDLVAAFDLGVFQPIIRAIVSSGEVDAVLLNGAFNNEAGASIEAERAVAANISDICNQSGVALSVATVLPAEPAMVALAEGRIPVFDYAVEAARCLNFGRRRSPRSALTPIDGFSQFAGEVDYLGSRDALANAGVTFSKAIHASDADEAALAANSIGYPVVLKALGSLHKSDSGAVILGIPDELTLRGRVADLITKLRPTGFSVEQMVMERDAVEVLIGGVRDPAFGPTVVVAAGGTKTEIWRDRVVALAPVDETTALRLLNSLRIAPLFEGFRGGSKVDLHAVAKAVTAVSRFVSQHENISEAEINPLIVGPTRCIAVDARIVLSQ